MRALTEAVERAETQDHGPLVREVAESRGWRVGEAAGGWTLEDGGGRAVRVQFDEHGRVADIAGELGPG